AAFKVTAPASRLVAFRGQPAILGCEFTPDSNSDLSSLVVTWQRREDSRVVHSFYYQKDQLDRQSREYRNRTSLFMAELGKGNASLRIEAVRPEDKGQYLCMVSNTRGTDKALMQLEYGAFYTEPRLSLIFSCSNVTVRYEAEGFPEPEVRWFGDQGQNLSHHTELRTSPDEPAGLYYLRSSYVAQIPALNVTFTLTNQLLRQHLRRPVNITYGKDPETERRVTRAVGVVPNGALVQERSLCGQLGGLEHPHTVPADGAVGVEVEGHQVFWTCDHKPSILVLTTVPPHTGSLGVSTKTKAGLVTEDDPLPF
ncbi:hypothetical protein NFI96_020173, partial [Prochilodus magdalenae]